MLPGDEFHRAGRPTVVKYNRPDPTVLVIFGAGGDLTWRKLIPAIYHLAHDGWLDERFAVIGVDYKPKADDEYRQTLREGMTRAGRTKFDAAKWDAFAGHVSYLTGDFTDPKTYAALAERFAALDKQWGEPAQRIFYLAIAPRFIGAVTGQIEAAGFAQDRERTRVVVEKPFGRDLESAKQLNATLTKGFAESQIY